MEKKNRDSFIVGNICKNLFGFKIQFKCIFNSSMS